MIPANKSILSRVGDRTTLPCTFTPKSSNGLIVTWTKKPGQTVYFFAEGKEDAGKQDERYKDRTFVYESRFKEGDFTLFLEDSRVSDEGDYECFVRFKPADFENSSLELYVAANYTQPVASCLQSDSTGSAQEASAVTLSCQTERGYPEAQLVWTFSNGTQVHSAAQHSANDSEGLISIQSQLVIARALSENVTCEIHNSRLSHSLFTSVTCSLPSSAGSFQNEERKRPGLLAAVLCFVSSLLLSLIVKKASCR
ncbi:CD276 antigen-like [Polyodon spathula]|uniref:CD276 antigen-like n=1 Tax=Polyodon spathula TaxID=7913 RepID=UPI001B7EDCDB|nr:CD276 antigen-like [Polyodon spathula]